MKIIGIDFGTKRIGIAISDDTGSWAFPKEVVKNDDESIRHIVLFAKENGVGLFVVGESHNSNMEDNPVMIAVRKFAEKLEKESGIKVEYESEFLTSHQAQHVQGKNEMLDASAAAIILQSYLDKKLVNNS